MARLRSSNSTVLVLGIERAILSDKDLEFDVWGSENMRL